MKDRIISFLLGVFIGGIIVYGYSYYASNVKVKGVSKNINERSNFAPSNMSDEQLERMAERSGITKDELKKKLESGESLRDIIPMRGNKNGSGGMTGSGNFNREKIVNGTGTSN